MRSYWVRKFEYNFSDHWELFKNFYINNDTPLAASTLTNFRFETADIFFRDLVLRPYLIDHKLRLMKKDVAKTLDIY